MLQHLLWNKLKRWLMIKQHVYFLGIGGIGMSGLAQYFLQAGHDVAGYDRVESDLTNMLETMGAIVLSNDRVDSIPPDYKSKIKTTVVYTPAIPDDSPQLTYFKNEGFDLFKRAEVLGELSKQMYCLAVGGTHGKTTTSSILAHLLRESGKKITAFLGGVSSNFGSNFINEGNELMVVEADEFDRSFLALHPDALCVTAMDADHLDIYDNVSNLESSFQAFSSSVKDPKKRWIRYGLPASGTSFGLDQNANVRVENIRIENGHFVFDFTSSEHNIQNLSFHLPGQHNLMNAAVSLAMALSVGCNPNVLVDALASFKGVDRRFSIRLQKPVVVIDDYAHHPTEINVMAHAVDQFYPAAKKTAVFQPHLFSRTRDFCQDFADSLSQFDHTLLLDIYPARELPIQGVSSASIQEMMNGSVAVTTKSELPYKVADLDSDVVVIMGAGDIADEVNPIVEHLKKTSDVG